VALVQPFAPHLAEETWERLGGARLWTEAWPVADERYLVVDTFECVVQVNGKVRDRVTLDRSLSSQEVLAAARALPNIRAHVDGRTVVKEIVVPEKLVNLVVR
jgi:leucyl-tRNA synthetase